MGDELEFSFVGWSLEQSFSFVSMPCSWIFPSGMLSPRPALFCFCFWYLCQAATSSLVISFLPEKRNISSIKTFSTGPPLTSETCQNKVKLPATKI